MVSFPTTLGVLAICPALLLAVPRGARATNLPPVFHAIQLPAVGFSAPEPSSAVIPAAEGGLDGAGEAGPYYLTETASATLPDDGLKRQSTLGASDHEADPSTLAACILLTLTLAAGALWKLTGSPAARDYVREIYFPRRY